MKVILLESGSKENMELVLTLARKLGIKTLELSSRQWEDHILAAEIEQGIETPTVSREEIMEALRQERGKKNAPESEKRVFSMSKGRYTLAPDFDAPLDDFKDYM